MLSQIYEIFLRQFLLLLALEIQTYLVLLHFPDSAILFIYLILFYKLRFLSNKSKRSVDIIFPTAFALSVSVSSFGNSHNMSDFFIIMHIMVICDQ